MDAAINVSTDCGLGLLSLPIEILEDILGIVVSQRPASIETSDLTFEQFYSYRKENSRISPYSIRFTCKRIDEAIVKHLFREVTIRLGWNSLFINPPLKELAGGAIGSVFRENARVLKLDQIIIQGFRVFEDDLHRDHSCNASLSNEVWYHYPEPMTENEKKQKYEDLMEEVRWSLPAAIASMSRLLEIHYKFNMRSGSGWLGSVLSKGLSTFSSIPKIVFEAHIQSPAASTKGIPIGEHLQAASAMKNLQAFELSIPSRCCLPSDIDEFWHGMQATGIKLRFISVNGVSLGLLMYLASLTGLQHLSLSSLRGSDGNPNPSNGHEEMASTMFNVVLRQHSQTLLRLALPCLSTSKGICWSISNRNITAFACCRLLTSLTVPFFILDRDMHKIRKSLELLLHHIQYVPSLLQLTLGLYVPRLHIDRNSFQKYWMALHDNLIEIQLSDAELLPTVITILYDTTRSKSNDYSLVESHSQSGGRVWHYYAEKPEWLGGIQKFVCGLHFSREDLPASDDSEQEAEEACRIRTDRRLRYAAEQRAKGIFPGDF